MGDLIAYVSGLSACLVALVSLTAIYISINNQHNIQKCREIFWELATSPLENSDGALARDNNWPQKIYTKVLTYDQIMKTTSDLAGVVLTRSRAAILLVMAVWVWMAWLYISNDKSTDKILIALFSLGALMLFLEYFSVMGFLGSIPKAAGLPSTEEILDVSKLDSNICSLLILAQSARLELQRYRPETFTLTLTLPVPFCNYQIRARLYDFITRISPGRTLASNDFYVNGSGLYEKYPFSSYRLCIIGSQPVPTDKIGATVQVESPQGIVNIIFEIFPGDFPENFILGVGYPPVIKQPIVVDAKELKQPLTDNWGISWKKTKTHI